MSKKLRYLAIVFTLLVFGLLILKTQGFGVPFIRNYVGDVLVVMFLYSALGVVTSWSPRTRAVSVCIFAFMIELSQLLHLQTGISFFDAIVLGSSFDFLDVVAYLIGGFVSMQLIK